MQKKDDRPKKSKLLKNKKSLTDSIKELEERESKMYWQKEEQDEFLDKKETRVYKLLKRNKTGED
jgi:hypothetical protein